MPQPPWYACVWNSACVTGPLTVTHSVVTRRLLFCGACIVSTHEKLRARATFTLPKRHRSPYTPRRKHIWLSALVSANVHVPVGQLYWVPLLWVMSCAVVPSTGSSMVSPSSIQPASTSETHTKIDPRAILISSLRRVVHVVNERDELSSRDSCGIRHRR